MEYYLGLPPNGSAHGPAIDHLIGLVHWLMLLLFVGWGIFFIYTLIRFRRSKQPQANYHGVKSHFSSYLEAGVLVAEIVLLVAFSIPLWSKRVDAFPAEKDATVVRIVAEQFAWNIHYPGRDGKFGKTSLSLVDQDNPLGLDRDDPDAKDDITALNQWNLPVSKPVIIYLTSKDVIHSLSLPDYRVKQDAIPGMSIPLWFTPTRTTAEIREELRQTFSIGELMKKVQKMSLPQMTKLAVKRGATHDDLMVMQDYTDNAGSLVLSKGDHLTGENMTKLVDAGVTEVSARPVANLDKYVSMEDYKDTAGGMVVAKSEALMEDQVTKLVESGLKEISTRPSANMDLYQAMESYSDKGGAPIISRGEALSEELITKLAEAGVSQVVIAPSTPTEIACAQLCGLGHFRMRGFMTVQTPEEFKKWYDDQEAQLTGGTTSEQTNGQASADTARVQQN